MASQTQGIQQLLAAEKRAAEKVSDARKRKCTRQQVALKYFGGGRKKYMLRRDVLTVITVIF